MTQSVFFPAHQKLGDLQYQFNKTLELAGCSPDHEAMSCLRAKTSRELQTVVNRALAFPGRASASRWYWTPCVDGDLIRDLPSAMFEQGNFIKVPLMLGTATDGKPRAHPILVVPYILPVFPYLLYIYIYPTFSPLCTSSLPSPYYLGCI